MCAIVEHDKRKGETMSDNVKYVLAEDLEAGMRVDLGDVVRHAIGIIDEETLLDFDAEWLDISAVEPAGNRIVVSVDRDYLPDVAIVKGTKIPVLIEE